MPDLPPNDKERVAQLMSFLFSRPGTYRCSTADSVLIVPCEPYLLAIRNTTSNIDIEMHLFANKDRWQGLEPLLNTRKGFPLIPKIQRFRTLWNEVRDDPENSFRLVATLAQVFAIVLPEGQEP